MGSVRQFSRDVARQSDLVLYALCTAATFYGLLLILTATHTVYHGTLKYVIVQGAGWGIGSVLYFQRPSRSQLQS